MGRAIDQFGVRRAWEKFVERGDVSEGLRTDVAASWKRCSEYQVSAESNAAPIVAEGEVFRHRAAHSLLAQCARPVFDRASKFMNESISMFILTDASGLIIETRGDERAVESGREIHLEYGGRWSESDIGTNAIGTAVALAQPVQINGAEHFCSKVQRWTCAAAPIRHPSDGEVLGVVDISGPAQHFSSQSLALAMVMSEYIQSLMAGSCKYDRDCLLDYYRSKQSKWLNDDILVIDRRGTIIHATDNAMRLAKHSPSGVLQGNALPILKNLPFDQWQARLKDLLPGASTDMVAKNECELGALIVMRSNRRRGGKGGLPADEGKTVKGGCEEGAQHDCSAGACSADQCDIKNRRSRARFVSSDPAVAAIVKQVELAAPRKMPILIRGETGTGKEELARHAHMASGRKGSFIALNCAAMPETLIEAELFGYVEGAFTGARRGGSQGLVKEADHGTLFLDEIGDMPITLQPVLLRFLDDWTARPIGGSNHVVDILLVSATNAKLDRSIAEGRFRSDLLYRLNTVDVSLPSLSERADFTSIVRHLLTAIDPLLTISDDAIAHLAARRWPGNIRELRNMLARLSLSAVDRCIDVEAPSEGEGLDAPPVSDLGLWNLQRARVLTAYEETQGNISETARRLGISRNTVYRALGQTPKR
ncbi:MAG: sigma-54-dependent Fis family transcriptional regulator [Hyphomicrobium sp.]